VLALAVKRYRGVQEELRLKKAHELALAKLKSLAMKKWHLGDPLSVVYMCVDAPWRDQRRKAKTASLVIRKEADGHYVVKNRWAERPMGILTPRDYAFFRTYTIEES